MPAVPLLLWVALVLQARPFLARSGSAPGERLGAEVALVGDLDGDGTPEWVAARGGETPDGARPELLVLSGRTGAVLHDLRGAGPLNELFLQSVVDLGDVDGDGVDDLAFGNSTARVDGAPNRGRVSVYSGRLGTRLHLTEGPVSFGAFGGALARLGDVDGDGVDDLVVGQIGSQDENAWLVSGATGALLGGVAGPGVGDPEFGWSVAATGDLDGDGRPDFAVGTLRRGEVTTYSANGARLRVRAGSRTFGRALADLGDLDGDGLHELAIAEASRSTVWIAAGRGDALVPVVVGGTPLSLARAGDLDGDGRSDLLVGDPAAEDGAGVVRALSTRTGATLAKLRGPHPGAAFGLRVAGGADLDGDGLPEILVGAPGTDAVGRGSAEGRATLWTLASPRPAVR